MHDLASFAAHLTGLATGLPMAERGALEAACKIVEAESKRVIGTYEYGWPKLKPATIARKKNGDTPLLESGEMRESIEHTVRDHEGYVGSNNKKAVYQELGTSRGIPPRSFLGGAARHKEKEVVEITGRFFYAILTSPYQVGGVAGWVGSGTNTPIVNWR
jgi:phage gpG-like protein